MIVEGDPPKSPLKRETCPLNVSEENYSSQNRRGLTINYLPSTIHLDEQVSGIDKRLDNQEFLNRGILVAVIVALIGGAAKLFGWLPTS